MANELIWSYLIHLSNHMWDDPLSGPRGAYRKPSYEENNNTDLAVWDEVIKNLGIFRFNTVVIDLGDAVQYESHPEIAAPDAWSRDFLRKKLDEIRALGIEPIPKLNFSACHDYWMKDYHRMVSTPVYYAFCRDIIKEVCELFDSPRLFHLGMDEETYRYQRYCDVAIIRNRPLWVHDLSFFAEECRKNNARPMMWGGMAKFYREAFENEVDRDIVMTTGFYGRYVHPWEEPKSEDPEAFYGPDLYRFYNKLGFDQIPCGSTWNYHRNQEQLLGFGKNELDPAHLLGYMTASWLHTKPRERYGLLHDAEKFYYARKEWYPETL